MKDCTTCKYGYKDERLGIPMCHHPKRFSEDCVDFNMHEEKESKESEKPILKDLEEAAEEYSKGIIDREDSFMCNAAFKAGAKWMAGQGVSWEDQMTYYDGFLLYGKDERAFTMEENFNEGDKVIVQIRKKED